LPLSPCFFLSLLTVATKTATAAAMTPTSYFRIKFTTRLIYKRSTQTTEVVGRATSFREYSRYAFSLRLSLSLFVALELPFFLLFLSFLSSFFAVSQLPRRGRAASIALESKLVSRLFDYVGGRDEGRGASRRTPARIKNFGFQRTRARVNRL